MLGLVNDLVGMWMGHVLQRARLQGRDPLAVVGGLGQRIWQKLGSLQKWTMEGILRKLSVAGSEEAMWKPSRRIRLSFGRLE